jgi:N-methylhydantoinase A
MRFAVDTGGTFTDLVVEADDGALQVFKSSSTPEDPLAGILGAFDAAAEAFGTDRRELLSRGSMLIHGTTWGLNAVITGTRARTAILVTQGHPDTLLFREGGRRAPFNNDRAYPDPYVPRSLTYEIEERVLADGRVALPLNEATVVAAIQQAQADGAEAIAVCLLWSIARPEHEQRIGELLEEHAPGIPYTLSHALNPTIREYRRAISASIDASLKPTMTRYFNRLSSGLSAEGFGGRLLVVSSAGGVLDAEDVASSPIYAINSGPAMAPSAGLTFSRLETGAETVVVADTGGTTFDVSLVRRGRIPLTRENYLGEPGGSDMTGFPSVDVRSVGAGGGTIAWVDSGGLLRFGPRSAGAQPGPACYGRGGTEPTLTDACLAAGYLDPDAFLGGAMRLDAEAAREALAHHVAEPLGMDPIAAAESVIRLATEQMALAIESVTIEQGIDPRSAAIIGGGGAAGLNIVSIGRRLGCRQVVIPAIGSALSAAGFLVSDLARDFVLPSFASTADGDPAPINDAIAALEADCEQFFATTGMSGARTRTELIAEARYPSQVWELELPVVMRQFDGATELQAFEHQFHELHQEVFATSDRSSAVEIIGWRMRAMYEIGNTKPAVSSAGLAAGARRLAHFPGYGKVETGVYGMESFDERETVDGPAIIEMRLSSVVVPPGARARRGAAGSLIVDPLHDSETEERNNA